ncbi:MAG: potassium-transporting ATPase potassium-binding subunit [Acidimicrobiia bacterium]|nr:potassium-transporting ATPase potassium-binding subunit [Acidimicrobiia bacterium]
MSAAGWLQLILLIAALFVSTPLLGGYMAKVYDPSLGKPKGDRFFSAVERRIYRLCGINPDREQRWTIYALSLLAFSMVSVLILYVQLRLQNHLPLNPDNYKAVEPKLAFNTAVSFLTNTNWQAYGDGVMSHFSQMTGLAFHNFVSAAAGAAVAVALIRGLVRRRSATIGNFWVDMIRTCIRILLPLAFVAALILMSQGVIDNFHASRTVTTVSGQVQSIPGGPLASQESIKEGGQNGGGFFGTNSAHPFENPNAITNFLQIWLMLGIPFALTYTFGKMARDRRQGWVVFGAMMALWLVMLLVITPLEARGNPHLTAAGASQQTTASQPGGNMEGKESRFGPVSCGQYAASTTSTSDGAVNCMHDSFVPLAGGGALVNMMYGEVSPGGTGSGLYAMLIFALLAVFIAGLMVGRTPEYLGKKIQGSEMKLAVIYILFPAVLILTFAGASVVLHSALASRANDGPHGLSEIVYAFTSAFNNNGSAFGGLSVNTQWYDTTLGIVMLFGRLATMIPVLAIAGSLGRKQHVPATAGTFPTGTALFGGLLLGVVIIVVGLTYFPVVSLGPVVEHLVGHF